MNAWNPRGLVLEPARAHHVVDALLERLDVSVQHRHVRAHAQAMRESVDRQIAIRVALVRIVGDLLSHALREDFGAAAGQRVEPGCHQLAKHLLIGHLVEIGEERDLDGGETLQVDVRPDALETPQQIRVVTPRQVRMQSVDDVDFGQWLVRALAQLVPGLLERQRVRARVAWLQARKGAEETAGDADVGRFEPDVVVVERAAAVAPLALTIREPADRQEVGGFEEPDAVRELQPRSGRKLFFDVEEPSSAEAGQGRHHIW